MKTKNIILYIVICLIVIAGIAVWNAKGFKSELQYSSRDQMQLSKSTEIKISDMQGIASEVLEGKRFFVQPVEIFGNAVSIVADEITEEEKTKIVEKFNEKYGTSIDSSIIDIQHIPATRVIDVIKPFILPGILTLAIILLYFLIRFKNIGWEQILLKTLLVPVVAELLMFSIMAIIRIPFGRLAIALGVGLYCISTIILTVMFENQKEKHDKELENNN